MEAEVRDGGVRRSLGRYDLVRELGRGGMGVVWAGYDREHRREVAVKLIALRRGDADLATVKRRFLREASITGRLRHAGIPAVHDHGSHEGELYLVMDLVPGRALDDLLEQEGRLPVDRAVDLARRTAEVLAHAHGQNVIHRDLKPSNLMVTPDRQLKVLDFGIATALEPLPGETRFTATNGTPGTAVYMAPEQALGRTVPASDLYSLGCVLYELLAGEPPFTGATPFVLYHLHAAEPVPPLSDRRPDTPRELRALVEGLLEKKPEDRPATAAEVAERLAAWAPPDALPLPAAHAPDPRVEEIRALRLSGRPALALDRCRTLLDGTELAPADRLAARVDAALCDAALGRTPEALAELRSVLAEQRSLLGPGSPAVLDTRYEIAVLMVRTGERHAAEELLRRLAGDEEALPDGDVRRGRSDALLARLRRMA
ncbi:serine/threonine-protein kinase [Streptomyces sp. MJP52]|uniref:serine/threonine-protein kinase n=1 Tax=Streptomyces sp. MJP52 TaxID=2940555 RepID=UPI00247694B7|nr:serine/threonine-protein kinase [Streptomyces sp. MJP52]